MSLYKGDTLIAGNNNVGVGKSETVLWSGSASSAGTVMDLSDDFTNYDELVFVSFFGSGVMNKEMKANVNELYSNYLAYPTISTYHLLLSYFSSNYYGLKVITNTQFKIQNASTSGFLTKIIGVKYAKVVQANPASYTLGEQVIGTWIDGKPIYRRVFYSPTNAYTQDTQFNIPYVERITNNGYLLREGKSGSAPSVSGIFGTDANKYVTLKWADGTGFSGGTHFWCEYTKTTD